MVGKAFDFPAVPLDGESTAEVVRLTPVPDGAEVFLVGSRDTEPVRLTRDDAGRLGRVLLEPIPDPGRHRRPETLFRSAGLNVQNCGRDELPHDHVYFSSNYVGFCYLDRDQAVRLAVALLNLGGEEETVREELIEAVADFLFIASREDAARVLSSATDECLAEMLSTVERIEDDAG